MKDQLLTLLRRISEDSRSAISLLESGDGHSQLDLLAGQMTDPCGAEAHPANPSVSQEIEKEKTTLDISGPSSSISSASASLQQSLENRLRAQLGTTGSTIYKLTWKQKATPAQWQYCQLVASVPRTKETDSSMSRKGWATPNAADSTRGPVKGGLNEKGQRVAKDGTKFGTTLVTEAQFLTGWATPQTRDWKESYTNQEAIGRRIAAKGTGHSVPLDVQQLSAWATPNSRDWKDSPGQTTDREAGRKRFDQVPRQAFGIQSSTPTAETESTAPSQLNPRFSLWLMGYPIEWAYCGERVMLSSRKQARKS